MLTAVRKLVLVLTALLVARVAVAAGVDPAYLSKLQSTAKAISSHSPVRVSPDLEILTASVGPGATWREVVRFLRWPPGMSERTRLKQSTVLRAKVIRSSRQRDIDSFCQTGSRSRAMLEKGITVRRVALAPDMGHIGLYEISFADCRNVRQFAHKKKPRSGQRPLS